jgi:hypothetical protein
MLAAVLTVNVLAVVTAMGEFKVREDAKRYIGRIGDVDVAVAGAECATSSVDCEIGGSTVGDVDVALLR